MKKRYLIIILALISLVIYFGKANAATDITSLPSGAGSSGDSSYYWPVFGPTNDYVIKGMRVTLMKTDGTRVGNSYNIIASDSHFDTLYNSENYTVLGTGCSKVQYLMGKSGCDVYSKTVKSGVGNPWGNYNSKIGAASNLSSYFSYFNVSLQSYIEQWKLDEIWQWADTTKLNLTDDRIKNLYKELFGLSDSYINDIATNLDLFNDLWISVEPISLIVYNGTMYLGTSYELGYLGYVNWKAVNSVMGRALPCAALTTGTIIQKYPDAPGVASGSYFNGSLKIVDIYETASYNETTSLGSVCAKEKGGNGSDILAERYVTGNSGAGIGLIYFRDTVKTVGLTCAEVNSGISNYNNFIKTLSTTYKSGGINALYQLPEVKNGIKYTYNGQQKVADSQWYINECTCYGAYNAYKQSSGTDLYKLPSASIKTIFNNKATIFTNFVNNFKQYVTNKQNTDPNSVGNVTEWDYNKYERYACGHAEGICQDVDFANANLTNPYENVTCDTTSTGWNWSDDTECLENKYSNQIKIDYFNENCKNLPLYLDSKFTDAFISSNEDTYNKCFQIYQEYKGGPLWTVDTYQESGCVSSDNVDKDKLKYNCTPIYNVGTCIDGENIYYNDFSSELNEEDYWKYCVFSDNQASYDINPHKFSDKTETLTYYDENISSDYCEVYCVENLTGAFNSDTINVKAGQYFVWGGHNISGNRTCRTKSIEWDEFESDLEEMNNKIEKAFNEYLVARDQQNSITYSGGDKTTSETECSICTKINPDYPCKEDDKNNNNQNNAQGNQQNNNCDTQCLEYEYYEPYYTSWDSAQYGNGSTAASGIGGSSGPSCVDYPSVDFEVEKEKKEYQDIVNEAKRIYNEMLKCYNADKSSTWVNSSSTGTAGSSWDQWLYSSNNVDPKAYVNFEYKINGISGLYKVENELMNKEITFTDTQNINDCRNVIGGIEVLTSCDSETNSCTRENLSIKKCTDVKMSKGVNIKFTMPDGIYQFIGKDNHVSYNADQIEAIKQQYLSQGKTFNYIYLGFSNFPIEYKTPDGLYGEQYDNGLLSITYEDLGYKLPNKVTAVDTILKTIESTKYGKWSCDFEVSSELIPEKPENPDGGGGSSKEGDINLIYRPIDLYNPFPDINAGGRNTGSNWCYGFDNRNDCSNTNQIVDKYILKNRGVKGHEIYSEEPMYTFILTPSIIKEIRDYNNNNSYADYAGSLNNETYDFKCNSNTGKTCISEYLTYLIEITGAKNLPGTCVDDKYRTYNDPDNFDACRY